MLTVLIASLQVSFIISFSSPFSLFLYREGQRISVNHYIYPSGTWTKAWSYISCHSIILKDSRALTSSS